LTGALTKRFGELQVLRAMAAAMVVFEHAAYTFDLKVLGQLDSAGFYEYGEFGVKLFFCISGFIIFNSAARMSAGWTSASDFAVRRLIRIVPLYWAATSIYAAKLSLQGTGPGTHELLASLLFIPYAGADGVMRPVLGMGWTLNFEMFFYATLAASLFFNASVRLPAVAGALLLLMLARATGWVTLGSHELGTAIYLLADSYLLFFLAGMLISYTREARLFTRLQFPSSAATLGLVLLVALVSPLVIYLLARQPVQKVAVELVFSVICVMLCVHARSSPHWLKPGAMPKLAIGAGDGSYSTYLTHGFVIGPCARVLAALQLNIPFWVFSAAMVLLCTALGMLLYRYFELPLLTAMNQWWRRARVAQKSVAI
jgi:exopolysaccharide production protein ExoZ